MITHSARVLRHAVSLYETDVHLWAKQQAQAVREGRTKNIDWDNVAEEIESLGRSDQRALESRLDVLLAHLLKCLVQPERRTRSWDLTIGAQRDAITRPIARNPSLRSVPADYFEVSYLRARRLAARDTGLGDDHWPVKCPFSLEQALDPDFLLR